LEEIDTLGKDALELLNASEEELRLKEEAAISFGFV